MYLNVSASVSVCVCVRQNEIDRKTARESEMETFRQMRAGVEFLSVIQNGLI